MKRRRMEGMIRRKGTMKRRDEEEMAMEEEEDKKEKDEKNRKEEGSVRLALGCTGLRMLYLLSVLPRSL